VNSFELPAGWMVVTMANINRPKSKLAGSMKGFSVQLLNPETAQIVRGFSEASAEAAFEIARSRIATAPTVWDDAEAMARPLPPLHHEETI
jgi:hypothetical protein